MVFTALQLAVYHYTYAVAIIAAIVGLPIVKQYQLIAADTNNPDKADFNVMFYTNGTSTPFYSPFPGSNTDTRYADAKLDLTNTPIKLTTPDTKHNDIWYTIQLIDAHSNTFINLPGLDKSKNSKRYLLVGPDWDSNNVIVSNDIKIIKCPTNIVWLVSRVEVVNYDNNAAANIMHQITIEEVYPGADVLEIMPFDNSIYSNMNFFSILTQALNYNPLPKNETNLIDLFATVGLKTPFIIPTPGSPVEQAYLDALNTTMTKIMPFAFQYSTGLVTSNFWNAGTKLGVYGDDYLRRAYAITNGYAANVPTEQFYPSTTRDSTGASLNAALHNYTIHFGPGEFSDVADEFRMESLTVYNTLFALVPNVLNKWAIGTNTGDLEYNEDDSLDVYIQYTDDLTYAESVPNLLVAPNGPFALINRKYHATTNEIFSFYMPPVEIDA